MSITKGYKMKKAMKKKLYNSKDKNGIPHFTLTHPKIRSENGVLTDEMTAYLVNHNWSDSDIEWCNNLESQTFKEQGH